MAKKSTTVPAVKKIVDKRMRMPKRRSCSGFGAVIPIKIDAPRPI